MDQVRLTTVDYHIPCDVLDAMADMNASLDEMAHKANETRSALLEMLAAAYIKITDIDPGEAVLVQKTEKDCIKFWFERKGDESWT